MKAGSKAENERILTKVEEFGGGYVWDSLVFAVTLIDVSVTDKEALELIGLTDVEQIGINALNLSFSTIQAIAKIPSLKSLVLFKSQLNPKEYELLQMTVPELIILDK